MILPASNTSFVVPAFRIEGVLHAVNYSVSSTIVSGRSVQDALDVVIVSSMIFGNYPPILVLAQDESISVWKVFTLWLNIYDDQILRCWKYIVRVQCPSCISGT